MAKGQAANIELQNEILLQRLKDHNESKPIPTNSMGIVEMDLPDDDVYARQQIPTSSQVGVQEGVRPFGQYQADRMGYLTYYPNSEVMDLISEDLPAKFSHYKGMAAYKAGMAWGALTKSYKYRSEKAKMEKATGRKVYWDLPNMKWRLGTDKTAIGAVMNKSKQYGRAYYDWVEKIVDRLMK